jgi:hypothetical protein
MARPQTIHPDPSRNGAPPRAQTAASAHQGHETNLRRDPSPPWIRTGLPQTIRRNQLRLLVPLADSTIYEMEQRGEFPRRFWPDVPLRRLGPRRSRGLERTEEEGFVRVSHSASASP